MHHFKMLHNFGFMISLLVLVMPQHTALCGCLPSAFKYQDHFTEGDVALIKMLIRTGSLD